MIKIVRGDQNDSSWMLITEKNKVTGTMAEILNVALKIGIPEDEICYAMNVTEENDHVEMEFGINKVFLFSR